MRKQWMLVRNYGAGLGFSWQESFQMTEKAEVEAYFRNADLAYEWKDSTHLRTRHIRPAITSHPFTHEMVWFNEIVVFHVSTLEKHIREAMLAEFKEEDLPANTYYGDGSPIELSILDELREAYRQETVTFPWQAGDILMLDNMLAAHGRARYVGPRKILVGMSDPYSWKQLQEQKG
jgi:alpha-ketoglutarate-dependent taurine dioxygenase